MLQLIADNSDYATVDVAQEEILELWKANSVYSTYSKPPVIVEERLTKLEQTVQQLNLKIKKLEK
ncbi:hypothetical protein [Pontibacter cellulosilyticus]|uniref:Uncharacterized protein n=1 Tax=Pontibacter cellulosilyticus TaxID=1720253 RepID=A0A923NBM5_9BACT|nr:hypothetical protein [Pontibacter cellulosilyticus]MBC5994442.1 hypothetical protein [Pontibacter cellulosilyticus]